MLPYSIMTINVNNIEWTIVFTSNPSHLNINGNLHLGVTDNTLKTVYIYNGLNGVLLRKVLLHELTHVWIYSYQYSLSVDEEEFICSFVDNYCDDIISNVEYVLNNAQGLYLASNTFG